MNRYSVRLTVELVNELLKGRKVQYQERDILFTILPPQEGIFITEDELDEIIRDRTNSTERILKLLEKEKADNLPSNH